MTDVQQDVLQYFIGGLIILLVIFGLTYLILKKLGKDPRNILPVNFANRIMIPMLIFWLLFSQKQLLLPVFSGLIIPMKFWVN
jgi:hypothetical protein